MMNNLYVFAIGGSGERVMKSLIMMLTTGMPLGAKKLIPVFVDNDVKSNALTSCLDLINYYRSNPETGHTDKVGLHTLCGKTSGDLGKVPTFAQVEVGEPVILNIAGEHIGNLDKIIGNLNTKDKYEDSINEEKNLLFTEDDLEMPLTVGFVGNPNIGSVVLNSLSLQGDSFTTIEGDAGSSDGVFVIGSLFGGTGAAGFPLIVNKFMSDDNAHKPLLGGVAVLPYFNLNAGDGTEGLIDTKRFDVDCETFTSKTRAALMYYDEYMRNMHYMYYVGDSSKRSLYPHFVGGKKQENPYNIIEVMAALSVVNFSNKDANSKPNDVVYQMPIWDFDKETLSNISSIRNKALKRSLVKFQMMKAMFESTDFIKWNIEQGHEFVKDIKFDSEMRDAVLNKDHDNNYPLAWSLRNMFEQWDKWMGELGGNRVKRQLQIFNSNGVTVTRENISQLFFSDNPNGIAKTETVREWEICPPRRVERTKVLSPQIEDAMLKAYRSLGVKTATASREKSLSTLLLVISKALDDVIDNYCDL